MKGLTDVQRRVLEFMERYASRHGMPPTVREIARHFGISSPNGVAVHLAALERKGYLRRRAGLARGIEFVRRRSRSLPVAGTIAAGRPVEAVEDRHETLDIGDMFRRRDCYVLRVKGDSMVDDCIQEGDYVIAIDGQEVRSDDNVYRHLENKAGKVVSLRFNRQPTPEGAQTYRVKTTANIR